MNQSLLQINGVLETCLYVDDLDTAESFYRKVLGLTLESRQPERHVFFYCGRQMLLLFLPEVSGAEESRLPRHGAAGPGHVAFRIEAADLDKWRRQLTEHQVDIEQEVEWPNGCRSLYFRDPAGNSLELAIASIWGLDA